MDPLAILLLVIATVFCAYMAWNIGANDVANAMGTSVGSKALTLRQAIIIAAVFEFCGAVFVGSRVTDTIRRGMVDTERFTADPLLLVYGMLAALLAAAVWLNIAPSTPLCHHADRRRRRSGSRRIGLDPVKYGEDAMS